MTVSDAANSQISDYPAGVGVLLIVLLAGVTLFIAGRFDPTGGMFTLSLMIVIAFIGIVIFSSLFVIPISDTNASVIGGLIAAFGAVVAFWLGRGKGNS